MTYVSGSSALQAIDASLTNRNSILEMQKAKLLKTQAKMKVIVDQKCSPHQFKVGDFAIVELRPYRQISVGGKRIHKLSKRYY